MISQNPWGDTLVTSAGEVLRPSASDFIKMLLDQIPSLCQLLGLQPVVGVKLDHWFNPELRLTRRMLDVHMGSRFLAREEIEAIATDPENRRTHATKNIRLISGVSLLRVQGVSVLHTPIASGVVIRRCELSVREKVELEVATRQNRVPSLFHRRPIACRKPEALKEGARAPEIHRGQNRNSRSCGETWRWTIDGHTPGAVRLPANDERASVRRASRLAYRPSPPSPPSIANG